MSLIFIVLLLIIAGFLFWQYLKFPTLSGPVTKSYSWSYKETSYDFTETLYQSTASYYAKKIKGIYSNFEERSLSKYFKYPQKDKTIPEITEKLEAKATEKKLSSDQTIDLALNYVQEFPYDEARAKTDLTHPRYPYETLYEEKGICSDKTLLLVAILREMGYGTAIFMYENDQHMAPAVQCPVEYSNYKSGYCIAETTALGHKIGIIPQLDQKSLQAVSRMAVQTFENQNGAQSNQKKLSTPEIYSKTTGKSYQGVIQTIANEKEIGEISTYLDQEKLKIDSSEAEMTKLKEELDLYEKQDSITKYNNLVPRYNNLIATIRAQIEEYNQKVNRYNDLIKQ